MADVPGVPGVPMLPRTMRQLLGPLGISATGMSRQQKFIEVIANNIANAETTGSSEASVYHRQVAVIGTDPKTGEPTVTVKQDATPGDIKYEPFSPDADVDGNVHYSNVNRDMEMMNLMIARRMHDANATVFQSAKAMLRKALDI